MSLESPIKLWTPTAVDIPSPFQLFSVLERRFRENAAKIIKTCIRAEWMELAKPVITAFVLGFAVLTPYLRYLVSATIAATASIGSMVRCVFHASFIFYVSDLY